MRFRESIAREGFTFVAATEMRPLLGPPDGLTDWPLFAASWNDLPVDTHLPEGHRYRRRRHATLSARAGERTFRVEAHQPRYQSLDYNPLVGAVSSTGSRDDARVRHGVTAVHPIDPSRPADRDVLRGHVPCAKKGPREGASRL